MKTIVTTVFKTYMVHTAAIFFAFSNKRFSIHASTMYIALIIESKSDNVSRRHLSNTVECDLNGV